MSTSNAKFIRLTICMEWCNRLRILKWYCLNINWRTYTTTVHFFMAIIWGRQCGIYSLPRPTLPPLPSTHLPKEMTLEIEYFFYTSFHFKKLYFKGHSFSFWKLPCKKWGYIVLCSFICHICTFLIAAINIGIWYWFKNVR